MDRIYNIHAFIYDKIIYFRCTYFKEMLIDSAVCGVPIGNHILLREFKLEMNCQRN